VPEHPGAPTVPFEPTELVPLGRTALRVSRLGFGGASVGGLFAPVGETEAGATLERAWEVGVRYFDTAPLYGYGLSERRVGAALRGRDRATFVLSTKVGRLIRPIDAIGSDADVDHQAEGGRDDAFYPASGAVRPVFDYTADGIRRSIDESLERLGLDRIDIAFIHDPDDHWQAAIDGAYPALHRLREEGVLGAIGAGMNQSAMLTRFAREADFDAFLLAGRYTLLDQEALPELLPLCLDRGIAIVLGGVMNSGILAGPRPGSRFDYRPADPRLLERARRLDAICIRHETTLKAAAIQFPLAHPAIACLVAGVRDVAHLDDYPAMMRASIDADLWVELRAEGLIPPDAPTPA
jgi:D-threo-aldose 1-dehydrogenase